MRYLSKYLTYFRGGDEIPAFADAAAARIVTLRGREAGWGGGERSRGPGERHGGAASRPAAALRAPGAQAQHPRPASRDGEEPPAPPGPARTWPGLVSASRMYSATVTGPVARSLSSRCRSMAVAPPGSSASLPAPEEGRLAAAAAAGAVGRGRAQRGGSPSRDGGAGTSGGGRYHGDWGPGGGRRRPGRRRGAPGARAAAPWQRRRRPLHPLPLPLPLLLPLPPPPPRVLAAWRPGCVPPPA